MWPHGGWLKPGATADVVTFVPDSSNLYTYAHDIAEYSKWLAATAGILVVLVGAQAKDASTKWAKGYLVASMVGFLGSFLTAIVVVFETLGRGIAVANGSHAEWQGFSALNESALRPLAFQLVLMFIGILFAALYFMTQFRLSVSKEPEVGLNRSSDDAKV